MAYIDTVPPPAVVLPAAVRNATVANYLDRVERAVMGTTYEIMCRWDARRGIATKAPCP